VLWKSNLFVILPERNQNFSEIFLENRNFFGNCLKKSKFFGNFLWKINFLWNYLKKSKFLGNLPWKINFMLVKLPEKIGNFPRKSKFCWPGSTTPQISNQIDAADISTCNPLGKQSETLSSRPNPVFQYRAYSVKKLFACGVHDNSDRSYFHLANIM